MRRSCLAILLMAAAAPAGAADRPGSLLAAAREVSIPGDAAFLPQEPPAAAPVSSWRLFWQEHRIHFAAVVAAENIEHLYANRIGPSGRPLLFGDPPGFDAAVYEGARGGRGDDLIARHKTSLTRLLSAGVIAAAGGRDPGGIARDMVGLVEAWKLNLATTGLVKMIVGRRRPELDLADPGEVGSEELARLQARAGGRLSFYSAATSSAFTAMSYADAVVGRRLAGRPWARRLALAGLYGFAGAVGRSRLRQGEHYLTDVLAGAAAGTLVGRSFHRLHHGRAGAVERSSRVRWLPPAPAPGGGLRIGFAIDLSRAGPETAGGPASPRAILVRGGTPQHTAEGGGVRGTPFGP